MSELRTTDRKLPKGAQRPDIRDFSTNEDYFRALSSWQEGEIERWRGIYESAVKGRGDFRKAYASARTLLMQFADAWEGKPGHQNMDRLCELVRNGSPPDEGTT